MLIPSQLMEGENLSNMCLMCPVEKRGLSEQVLEVTRPATEMILLPTPLPVCPGGLWFCCGSLTPFYWKTNLSEHLMVSSGCPASFNSLVSAPSYFSRFSLCKSFILMLLSFETMFSASFDSLLLTFMAQFFLLHCGDLCGVIFPLLSVLLKLLYVTPTYCWSCDGFVFTLKLQQICGVYSMQVLAGIVAWKCN